MGELKCGWNPEELLEYASGRLDAAARSRVEGHLEACASCREIATGQQSVWKALDTWDAPPVSAGFDRRLAESLTRRIGWRERLAWVFAPSWIRLGIPAAACLVFAGLVVLHKPTPLPAPVVTGAQRASAVLAEPLKPDQVDDAVMDMETLREFDGLMQQGPTDSEM
jgi:anti-sigma factor RsiW